MSGTKKSGVKQLSGAQKTGKTQNHNSAQNCFSDARPVSLEEVLSFREEKQRIQKSILAKYQAPLLCLGLNIPGEYKRFPLADRSFQEELSVVRLNLLAEKIAILHEEFFESPGGYAAFISAGGDIKSTGSSSGHMAEIIKEITIRIEETHTLGRLFDIDVLQPDCKKISRGDCGKKQRPCLICGEDAFACGRNRTHTVNELQASVTGIMRRFQQERLDDVISAAVIHSLMGEVAVTPKPGLVDRANTGAHRDMDFFSFIDSTAVLLPYFRRCAQAGFAKPENPEALFFSLRPKGKIAELEMREAVSGANPHRGIIFSIGLASAAYGALFRNHKHVSAEQVLVYIASMTRTVLDDFQTPEGASHGEQIFRQYGIGGVRAEARAGFPLVRNCGLPVLRRYLQAGYQINDAALAAFLHLLGTVTDTNIIHRSDPATLAEIQASVTAFLASNPDAAAMTTYARQLDREFIKKNISPGGCADLLALSLFLFRLCEVPLI